MTTCPNSFLTWGIITKRFCYTIFIKKYSKRKLQFLEDWIFFFKLLFSYHPGNLVNIPCWQFFLGYHESWIYNGNTQSSQIHCCINYKICLDMFLPEHTFWQFSFCDTVCFHHFERFARHLQVFHVQQFLLTWLVNPFFTLKYFQQF